MSFRYFITFSYKGTAYHGWQKQPNAISVQEVLEKSLSMILNSLVEVVGAGRTDTGVHARKMVAHFDQTQKIENEENLVFRLNSLLPKDIAVEKVELVSSDKHARFSARSRTYEYHVMQEKNPFGIELATRIIGDLDFDLMNEAASHLLQYTDFTSFSKLHTDTKTNNCKITEAYWKKREGIWVFTITADRFLRNMVRAIVGTLLCVGRGRMTIAEFDEIILAKDRCRAGTSAPAEGLYLVDVKYD
ncbi:MAG: tRNA pseudouridine(38-40) synthase TruA [Paludibacteraceae bacterium]|nr:tRNA pseudouridine(38-40) synthase TruA [Paludibacteraceae bacterium]